MRTFLSPRSKSATHNVPDINVQEPTADDRKASGAGMSSFVSKSRKVRFDLSIRIIDLNNVPLVSGTSFIKWHLPSSTAAEHRGRTNKCAIRDHRVAYEYEKRLPVRLTVGKDGMLQECWAEFEVLQEYSASGRGERIELGNVKLNLAEYVDAADPTSPGPSPRDDSIAEDGGIVRRHLMQDSKINSTLKLGINMRYVDGPREYFAPPLRTAPVFGGIAGIISSSEPATTPNNNNTNEDGGAAVQDNLPNLSTRNKELGEMQDMYRRTLAAFWASQPGELKADECIEDIFAGGDGWGSKINGNNATKREANNSGSETATNNTPRKMRERAHSNAAYYNGSGGNSGASTPRERDESGLEVTGRGEGRVHAQGKGMLAMGRQGRHSKNYRGQRRGQGEVDEFEVREDLRSWRVGEAAVG